MVSACFGQQTAAKDTTSVELNKSLIEILELSDTIDNESFDLEFLLQVKPENAWKLILNRDSTYKYIHFSPLGPCDGSQLEKGKYHILKNKIEFHPNEKNSLLIETQYYLATWVTEDIDMSSRIDCYKVNSKIYCLHQQ